MDLIPGVRYDPLTGDILEMSCRMSAESNVLQLPMDMVLGFMDGTSNPNEYMIVVDNDDRPIIIRKQDREYIQSFWELCDAESDKSPIIIEDKSPGSFLVTKKRPDQVFSLFITAKNDPNVLLGKKVISSGTEGTKRPMRVEVFDCMDYSIYVGKHVT